MIEADVIPFDDLLEGFSSSLSAVWLAEHRALPGTFDDRAFMELARKSAASPPCVILLSGGDPNLARYSVAAFDPVCTLEANGNECILGFDTEFYTLRLNPLTAIDSLLSTVKVNYRLPALPFCGGLIGYLSYELKNVIETLPQTSRPDPELPDLWLMMPTSLLLHDRLTGIVSAIELEHVDDSGRVLQPIREEKYSDRTPIPDIATASNFSRDEYCNAVRSIVGHISAGDVYQINLSQRFRSGFCGDAFEFWTRLYQNNPASHYAYIDTGEHSVLSTSMERFLYRKGNHMLSQPIKGTRKRGTTRDEDARLREELLQSPKDDAELSMIVDLVRNDLGRVCRTGSVSVAEHKRIDAYRNVFHLSSIVVGTLPKDIGYADILRATFPAGSITGCPKIRAMELIDQFEPDARHTYTGSIGYFGFHNNMDLSVAIRTAILKNNTIDFSVGGGIVYDSDPDEEYEETLHKSSAFFEVLNSFMKDNHG